MKFKVFRTSGLPLDLTKQEMNIIDDLPLDQAMDFEETLRKSGRILEETVELNSMKEICEYTDAIGRNEESTIFIDHIQETIEILDVSLDKDN